MRFITLVLPLAGAFLALGIALWGIGQQVWVARVLENMPPLQDVPAFLSFATSAFVSTDLIVQMLSILLVAAAMWLMVELIHTLKHTLRFV